MAITINGSTNSITGLANGGLPDGCILDADINGMAASKLTGALPAISGANLTGLSSGLSMANQWRMSSNQTIPFNTYDLIGNWEEVDTHTSAKIGSSMTVSNSYFTFPSTGIYQITLAVSVNGSTSGSFFTIIRPVTNGSFPSFTSENEFSAKGYGAGGTLVSSSIFDVTDTSTHKVAFYIYQAVATGGIAIRGNSNYNLTTATFIKLGDT
tara:strand:+ start:1293 stop:1925 length:633 start_codon:yes stop_codon:yes gene_type:complete